jgi:carbon-monoxide dehydrogenase small subunit
MTSENIVSMTINGEKRDITVYGTETLLSILRDKLGLTGTKRGCNQGVCGACTIIVDGAAVRSCLSIAGLCDGADVITVEGLTVDRVLSPIQQAFAEKGAVQCGFCTSGMLLAVNVLLERNPDPTVEEIKEGISGNLCRCSGYRKVIDAVREAARLMKLGRVVS